MSLAVDDFARFFERVHGYRPFLWQRRLAAEVAESGAWPTLIDVPTGCGKTSVIDIAVFELARQLSRGDDRRAAIRTAFVVDRRVVVDEAYERARKLESFIASGTGILAVVGEALATLAESRERPLVATRLRGGVPVEDDWVRTPSQPAVLVSTVDQVGSRLLFDGYGVSDRMAPVHAGLLGTDTRMFLDEAHLAEPFRQTVDALHLLQPDRPTPDLTTLSATPGVVARDRFSLCDDELAEPIVERRTARPKIATLAASKHSQDTAAFARDLVGHARDLSKAGVVGIVVNRVATARAVHAVLVENDPEAAMLVIGRSRSIARDHLLKRLACVRTGSESRGEAPPFIVATQCIEAGADLDLDALVTQAAPLDALRQRFGRLNRAGSHRRAEAVVVASKDDIAAGGEFLYGVRTRVAWRLLDEIANEGRVDFAQTALERSLSEQAEERILEASANRPDAPVMMPAYLDLWTRTSPRPKVRPDVPAFLHGPQAPRPEVSLVWRADVIEGQDAFAVLTRARPRATEALALPIGAVRAWLSGQAPVVVGDVTEGVDSDSELLPLHDGVSRKAYRWSHAPERCCWVSEGEVRPGDVLVVPAGYGGCDAYGWLPTGRTPVRDLGHQAVWPFRCGRLPLRISKLSLEGALFDRLEGEDRDWSRAIRDLWAAHWDGLLRKESSETGAIVTAVSETAHALEGWLSESGSDLQDEGLLEGLLAVTAGRAEVSGWQSDPAAGMVVVDVRFAGAHGSESVPAALPTTDDDRVGLVASSDISLTRHNEDVHAKAKAFGELAGLPTRLVEDVALAGRLHDLGKADLRFQQFLTGSSEGAIKALRSTSNKTGEALAKSSVDAAWRSGRSVLPEHWRHECLSVTLALSSEALKAAHDPALVVFLVGSHHGFGRPFFPHDDPADDAARRLGHVAGAPGTLDAAHGPQRPDFSFPDIGPMAESAAAGLDWPQLFDLLRARYGYFGLARLEAIIRLADHRVSEAYGNA